VHVKGYQQENTKSAVDFVFYNSVHHQGSRPMTNGTLKVIIY